MKKVEASMKHIVLAAIFCTLSLSAAQADQCMDKAVDQASMNRCAAQAYEKFDADLNRYFHEIRQRLADDVDARHLLRDSQRAWITFRDAECAFAASAAIGGSVYPMAHDLCLADLTQKRAHELRQYLECEEGDMTCPVPFSG